MRTLHTGLRVEDMERSLAFYSALGYEVVGQVPDTAHGDLTMLKLPDDDVVSIELVHDPARAQGSAGLNHLVQVDDLNATMAELRAKGVDPQGPTSLTDRITSGPFGSPPDGHRFELVQWPAGHPAGMTEDDFTGPSA